MSVDVSIPLTSSPKKCGMEHTFTGCEILSCVASPIFFSSHCWSSIISHSWPHTQIIVKWYLQPRLHIQFLHKTLILKLCVPFPCVEPSQLSPICRALAVSSYKVFITLFHQDCFEISLGMNFFFLFPFGFSAGLFFYHKCIVPLCLAVFPASWIMDARMGGVVPPVPWGYLRHLLVKCHVTAHVAFPWSSSVETN